MTSVFQTSRSKNVLLLFAVVAAMLCFIDAAYAQYVSPDIITGSCSAMPAWMITSRLVQCLEHNIHMAMNSLLVNLTINMLYTIIVLMVFSMLIFGIKVFAGLEDITKDTALYFIKFGIVLTFAFSLGGLQDAPAAIMRYATSLVVGQWSPWESFDQYLCRLFGFCNEEKLFNGLMGMVFAAAFSGVTGVLVLIVSLFAMLTTIYFAFRAMFTYITAVMLISFLVVLTPLIVPLALFAPTSRYVEKWLDYLIAGIVHPVLLFAFLYMFMGTINTMLDWFINGVFLGNNDFSGFYRGHRNLFSWLMTADPNSVRMLENTLGETSGRTALQTFASPIMSQAVDINPVSSFALDFGVNQTWMMQGMVFGFLGLFIVSYLMLSMLDYLPEIADSITGVHTLLRLEGIPFVNEFRQGMEKLKGGMT